MEDYDTDIDYNYTGDEWAQEEPPINPHDIPVADRGHMD
jgi:hypothetical protein